MPMDGNQTRTLLKVDEVAAELGLSKFTIYRRIEQGHLPALRLGENGQLRVTRAALDEFLQPTTRETR